MSKTHFIGVIALLVALMVLMTGCGADPVTVAQQFQEAVNSQNVESALELLAEDASLKAGETSSIMGKDQIANWLTTQAELHYQFKGDPNPSETDVTFENCSINSYQWSYYGIQAMSGTCDLVVDGGLITVFAVQFDETSKASLADSSASTSADLVALWTSQSVPPGVVAHPEDSDIIRSFLQFADDGSARLAVSLDDLSTAPDSDHPGARFKWTYEDYVLTVQNDGPASEGYCQEQDIGTYLIRNVESASGNRMQFKLVSDSCEYRGRLFPRIAAPWDQYVP